MMVFVFALSVSGCATTQGGGGASTGGAGHSDSAPAKSGGMLTKKDYDRIGIKEMGSR